MNPETYLLLKVENPEERALLAAILNFPETNAPQLIYADWLDDHEKPEQAAAVRHGVVKRFGIDFRCAADSTHDRLTLNWYEVVSDPFEVGPGPHTKQHKDGWAITGQAHEGYFLWVEEFAARHDKFGLVWGNFEFLVFASSEEAFADFYANHPPESRDSDEI